MLGERLQVQWLVQSVREFSICVCHHNGCTYFACLHSALSYITRVMLATLTLKFQWTCRGHECCRLKVKTNILKWVLRWIFCMKYAGLFLSTINLVSRYSEVPMMFLCKVSITKKNDHSKIFMSWPEFL